ncbi:MAG: glycosyltransferase [Pyrinomonadaceae bacterium]
MKIVRVIARLNVGGPAKHVVWLTAGLQSVECDSLLVAGTVPHGEEDMGYFAASHGVKPFLIPQMSREISLKDLLTIWKLYRLFLRERPDIVHTHTAKAGTVGRIAGLIYRWSVLTIILGRPRQCRFVHTYHGHIFHSYYGPLKTRLFLSIEKILARLITDKIVVVSEQQRREIHEAFGVGRAGQFVVIPLGLDLSSFENSRDRQNLFRNELDLEGDEILVGIVGRLTEIKNHELFLHAVKRFKEGHMREQSRRVKFVVIGEGGLRGKLEAQANMLGLGDDVVFTGGRRDPENFSPALDIVALTSRNEGTPLTLIEAMANGRAVIATAVGGVVDLLGETISQDQNERYDICPRGVRVIPDDADAFAAGLDRLVEDIELRREMGDRGFHFVQTNYSKARLLEDIKALYRELLERRAIPIRAPSPERSLESRV